MRRLCHWLDAALHVSLLTMTGSVTVSSTAAFASDLHTSRCRPVYTWWEPTRPPIGLNLSNSTLASVATGVTDIVMLGWVTDGTGALRFTQGGSVPQSKAVWESQRTRLQALGFRVHAYIELNPSGTSHCATNASAAAAFDASVGSLMAQGWDGLQVSVEGCGPNENRLIPQYQQFIAGLKQQVGAQRELGVWIHEYCNEASDFCMTCKDYRQTHGFASYTMARSTGDTLARHKLACSAKRKLHSAGLEHRDWRPKLCTATFSVLHSDDLSTMPRCYICLMP
jgi:hypothetical protein